MDSVTSVSGIVRKARKVHSRSVIYSIARYSYSYHKGTDVATISAFVNPFLRENIAKDVKDP